MGLGSKDIKILSVIVVFLKIKKNMTKYTNNLIEGMI